MVEHKHAAVLRAIADGVPLSEFEVRSIFCLNWQTLAYAQIIATPDRWEVRRKPQYIMVNGFKVPKPLDVIPKHGSAYFIPNPIEDGMFSECYWRYNEDDTRWFRRGIVHPTKEAAIAHAKAMLGIDPKCSE